MKWAYRPPSQLAHSPAAQGERSRLRNGRNGGVVLHPHFTAINCGFCSTRARFLVSPWGNGLQFRVTRNPSPFRPRFIHDLGPVISAQPRGHIALVLYRPGSTGATGKGEGFRVGPSFLGEVQQL